MNVRVSLKTLSGKHSDSSAAVDEAAKLLTATIEQLRAAVVKSFDGNAVFVVVTLEERLVRSKRQVEPPVEEVSDEKSLLSPELQIILFLIRMLTISLC